MAKEPEKPDLPDKGRAQLEALFQRNYRRVVAFFVRLNFSSEDAKDLAQETFLRAGKGWQDFRGEASETTWLTEIARNIYRNTVRDRHTLKKQGIEVPLDALAPAGDEKRPAAPQLEDQRPSPELAALFSEESDRLLEAVHHLPAQRRQCLELRLRDLKYHEIASIMGISIETVKSHLYQARESLREALRGPG